MRLILALTCCVSLFPVFADESAEHTIAHALATFQLADPSLQIDLVAAEPDVIDPVAIAWDERGRMYVAEMRDYPVGPAGGTIRLLEDTDGDGKYETAHLFAEGLPFPNSVMPWRGGVLVSAAPDVIFLKDTNGDNIADERRVILSGFAEGNQQLRVNSLHLGLDNWVYAANGRSDGAVIRPGESADKAVPLRRHDLRFRPDTAEFQPIAGFSQFGQCEDDWGNRFLSWNTVPIRHVVLEEEFLARSPLLAATNVEAVISDPADTGRVFPIVPQQQRYNRESVEFFNASCGLHIYRGDALPALSGNAFICEPLTSLVHRRTLEPSGATFVSRRAESDKEFLASTDSWFRPVNVATGPDGALYIVDFCRKWVEHPDFVPKEFRDQVDWRTGDTLGRIWRIRKKDQPKPIVTKINPSNAFALVAGLGHENAWVRMTAQRLLLEKGQVEFAPALHTVAASHNTKAQLHALYTLQGIGALTRDDIAKGLADADANVRRHALLLSRPWLQEPGDLATTLRTLANDPDPRVRFELAQFVALVPAELQREIQTTLAARVDDDPWQRLALLTGLQSTAPDVFVAMWSTPEKLGAPGPMKLQGEIAELIGALGNVEQVGKLVSDLQAIVPLTDAHIAAFAGFAKGFERSGNALTTVLFTSPNGNAFRGAFQEQLVATAQNDAADPALRIQAIDLLARCFPADAIEVLTKAIVSDAPTSIRITAINALISTRNNEALSQFFRDWATLPISTRGAIIQGCLVSAQSTARLLAAVETQQVGIRELDGTVRETLMKYPDEALRARAGAILETDVRPNRAEIVQAYAPAITAPGNASRGAVVFKENCMPCHIMKGEGNRVGPDLSGIASRSKEKLISDILDPNAEVAPDFVAYTAVTSDLEVITGVLAGETPASFTFRQAQGIEQTVRRESLQELRASTLSLMPEGFESAVDKEAMANLLAYLRGEGN